MQAQPSTDEVRMEYVVARFRADPLGVRAGWVDAPEPREARDDERATGRLERR